MLNLSFCKTLLSQQQVTVLFSTSLLQNNQLAQLQFSAWTTETDCSQERRQAGLMGWAGTDTHVFLPTSGSEER